MSSGKFEESNQDELGTRYTSLTPINRNVYIMFCSVFKPFAQQAAATATATRKVELKMQIFAKAQKCKANNININIQE